jgi:Ca2+-binding EF-hand superfamily protein
MSYGTHITAALLSAAVLTTAAIAQDQEMTQEEMRLADICKQSWTQVDENQDGTISPDEAEKASEAEFRRIDANENGKISVKEWKACATPAVGDIELKAEFDYEEMGDDKFAELDRDQSGEVSGQEAAKHLQSEGMKTKEESKQTALSASRFAMMDTDGDNRISKQEWMNRQQAGIEQRFSMLDQDGNDQISQSEFRQYRMQRFSDAREQAQEGKPTTWVYYFYVL